MNHTITQHTNTPREAIEKFIRLYATDMTESLQIITAVTSKAKCEGDLTRQTIQLRLVRQTIDSMKAKLELMKVNILSLNENYPQ